MCVGGWERGGGREREGWKGHVDGWVGACVHAYACICFCEWVGGCVRVCMHVYGWCLWVFSLSSTRRCTAISALDPSI